MAEPHPLAAAAAPPLEDAAFARGEAWLWTTIAVGALAIAGVFALLLAISRIPGVETVLPWPVGFFHKGLVIHVVFSFVVWFLAVHALLAVLLADGDGSAARGRPSFPGLVAGAGAIVALPLLFVPALLDRGEATLNNYIPVIIDPLYYTGLVVLLAAVALPAGRLLTRMGRNRLPAAAPSAAAAITGASAAYAAALTCLIITRWQLVGTAASHAFNEDLFWAGGHVLQIVNTSLMFGAWFLLAGALPASRRLSPGPGLAASAVLVALAVAAPVVCVALPPFSAEQRLVFTNMQYGLGAAALPALIGLVGARPRPWPWRDPAALCLALSVALFVIGGALGVFVDGADTRTPAHYHGVIAAVTLAFMGVFYRVVLPRLNRPSPPERWQRRQIHLFAWGQLVACVGLFIAGGHGAPRKVAGDAQGLHGVLPVVGLGMNGLGGLIAVIGGVVFVVVVLSALLRRRD